LSLPRVDIVLPCYNPGRNWEAGLVSFHNASKDRYDLHFIIVNDGSKTGNVREVAEELRRRLPVRLIDSPDNHGKGYALRRGVADAQAGYILYTDIDFPFTEQSMADVLSALMTGKYDIVAGHRSDAYYRNKMSGFRRSLSKSFRFFLRRILRLPFADTQCGLKAFNSKGRELFLQTRTDRYLFDFEFIYRAVHSRDYRITGIEVQLKENVTFSRIRLKILGQETLNLLRILALGR
jgi:glycosyltransferase involved in cell wall biosynthesis